MEDKKPLNQFEEVHKRVREVRDHAREVQEKDAEARQERAEKEAVREGFDRPGSKLPPRLIADGDLKHCSVCGYLFQPDLQPSMSVAFADHLSKAHQPSQTTEDVNQVDRE